MFDGRDIDREIVLMDTGNNAVKRLLQTIGFIALGAFGTLALDAADFLTQAELDERLEKLRTKLPAWIGCVHRDRCYRSAEGEVAYEYKCPTCGHSTGYRDEVGEGCMPGVSNTIAWARESVAKLRALRLDISIDERGFCDRCRSALKIPDGGEIVRIPADWPERTTLHVFPFAIGDQVDIYREPDDNIFCIGKRVPDGNYPYGVRVPKEVVGKLTFAGEKTTRTDAKKLRWSINGRGVDIYDRTDILILETFLKGELRLPNWKGPDWDIRSTCHMIRLEELLSAKDKVFNWHPALHGEVGVDVDI